MCYITIGWQIAVFSTYISTFWEIHYRWLGYKNVPKYIQGHYIGMSFGLYQTFRLIFYEWYKVWMTNSSVFENPFWYSHYNLNVCLSVHICDIFFLFNLSPLYDVLHHIFTESSSSGYDNDQHKDIKKTKTQKNTNT